MGSTTADILLVCALTAPFIWLTMRFRILTLGGGITAGLVALAVVASQGWIWLAPLLLFLISGVLLGRLNRSAKTDAKHGKPRDAIQVLCNGGVYALLALADDFHADVWMTISICTATCDTWASEIGLYARWPTINIATLRKVPPGLSGGISLAGTLGGFAGALGMALFICVITAGHTPQPGWHVTIISGVLFFGASLWYSAVSRGGMLLDSVLGALFQPKFDDGAGVGDTGTRQVSGLRWMTNDAVNLVSNALTVALAVALLN